MTPDKKVEPAPLVPPFVRYVASAIPMVFDDSLSYYECLAALTKYLQDVVKVINNNGAVTEEYIQLTKDMKEYMDNYFENLDVQEEINNKLDDMVEQGTLQEIITNYIQANVAWCFDTVADMKSATNLIAGSYAQTLGFYALNDGGGAIYKITNSGTADESTVIAVGDLYANLIYDDKMNVKQFGAKADGTTDNTSIINIILGLGKNCLYFPDGTYLINDKLTLTNCRQITGQSMLGTVIKAPDGFASWDSSYKNYRFISNITFDGVAKNGNTCLQGAMAFSKWDNVLIKNYNIAYMPEAGTWINEFNYICVGACNYGFYNSTSGDFNNTNFISCFFQNITNVAFRYDGKTINFDNCNIEGCGKVFEGELGRNYNLHNCYIENNGVIFDINKASFNSSVVIDNCWLYGDGVTNGWLAKLFCPASADTTIASMMITNSFIENRTKDTIKPFSFQGDGNKTYWGVSLISNSYKNIKTSDPYVIYYDDLFDLTNCPQYTWPANPVTFKTDLPLYKYQNIVWYQESTGNMLGANRTNRRIKMVGRYAIEKTSGNIEITPDKKYGCIYPTKSNIPVLIRYSDGSIDYSFMSTSGTSFTIVPKYNSRTTVEVIFNNEFDTLLS